MIVAYNIECLLWINIQLSKYNLRDLFFLYKLYCEAKVGSLVLTYLLDGDELIFFPYYLVFLSEFFKCMSWFTMKSLAPLGVGEIVGTSTSCCSSLAEKNWWLDY